MAYQTVFQRYELRYLMTKEQKAAALQEMEAHLTPDPYGRTTIRNLYYDTPDYRMIRQSIDRPVYKEKLRVRSYEQTEPGSTVFVELKKKYKSVVYKRRLSLSYQQALSWIDGTAPLLEKSQISKEIDYCLGFYKILRPAVFLSYDREPFYSKEQPDFRVTFDDNILCRLTDLSLSSPVYGTPLIGEDQVLMELKCAGGIPLWMVSFLTRERIYKTSFSKYGTAYQTMIFPKLQQKKEASFYVRNVI